MPLVSLKNFVALPDSQKAIGEKFARRNRIVVLENSPLVVKLALGEPTKHIIEDLPKIFPRKRIEFYLAHPYEIDSCLIKTLDPFGLTNYR